MRERDNLKRTPDYDLYVSEILLDGTPGPCYRIQNRITEVVEAETRMLPQAYEWMEQLQSGVDARRDIQDEPKTANVVAI